MNAHILVVDDESAIRDMLRLALESDGFTVSEANSAHQAQTLLETSPPDLILLDWMMPGLSGIDFARKIKRGGAHPDIGIIMLTARTEEESRVMGLDVGADDYVTKPFSPRELIARINAVLRRIGQPLESTVLNAGKLHIDTSTHRVTAGGSYLELSPTEFRLLHFFVAHPERVYSRSQLLDHVWGENVYVEERTVDVHIRRLRKVLEPHNCDGYIQTVRSVGYRFSPADAGRDDAA
jgi:two-component system phosphate regulon response regulator PhoB